IFCAALLSSCLALLPSCAALAPDLRPPAPTSAAPPVRAAYSAAHADTVPSPDAERVLATIEEPLPASQRTAAPALADSSRPTAAISDRARAAADTANSQVPVPAPTVPLGDSGNGVERMMATDSTSAAHAPAAAGTGSATPAATGAPPPVTTGASPPGTAAAGGQAGGSRPTSPAVAASSEPCFRLQVGAPSDPHQADGLRRAAASQLEIAFDVVHVKSLYKVRSHDCVSRNAVDHLRDRAIGAGFHGVFAVAEGAK
ncbi:MAG: hypothetical protein HYR73_02265, partial [Candidatus Eisenbacteria bacterium]|nr:hypothetical protein [Candidatus Eisenbacteria bacterium]